MDLDTPSTSSQVLEENEEAPVQTESAPHDPLIPPAYDGTVVDPTWEPGLSYDTEILTHGVGSCAA